MLAWLAPHSGKLERRRCQPELAAARDLKISGSVQHSSPNTNTTVDLSVLDSDEEDEAPVRMTSKPIKRKARVHDSDSESEQDTTNKSSFAQRIAKHAASKKGYKAPAKKRRTSVSSRDDDDFIVPDDEEEEPDERDSKASSEVTFQTRTRARRRRRRRRLRAREVKADKKSNEEIYSFLKDPKDKDGIRHADEGHDPRTLFIPKSAWSSFTPFEKQFWEIKQNHYDTILFFQKGKFFELYENDAQIGHSEFDLKLTDRVKMKMVGVPESSFQFWAAKFLAKGYKVGRVDQAETQLGAEMRQAATKGAKGKGAAAGDKIVRRELNKVLTNGTLIDLSFLQDEQAGHCVSIRETEEEGEFGLCVLDAATGEFNLSAFKDDVVRTRLETIMRQIRPKELVFTKVLLTFIFCDILRTHPGKPFRCNYTPPESPATEQLSLDAPEQIRRRATTWTNVPWDSGVPPAIQKFLGNEVAIEALGSMIWYLRQLNIDKDILMQKNFNIYDPLQRGKGLALDGQTLSHIEVLVNSEGTEEGTLLKLWEDALHPSRLFRIWLCNPLQEVKAINERNPEVEASFTKLVSGIPDLERIVSRVHAKSCSVKDFLKVLTSFESLSKGLAKLADRAEGFKSKSVLGLLRQAPDLSKNTKRVRAFFNVEDDTLLVPSSDDVDEAYSEIQSEIKGLEEKLNKQLEKLKTDRDRDEGHLYCASPYQQKVSIPKDWTKHGGTKAITRYTVPALASNIRSLKESRETRTGIVRDFKLRVFAEFDADRDVWLRAVKVTAELDCLLSLAKASEALGSPSCRPEFVEDDGGKAFVEFVNLRHPALELNMKREFIANSVRLGGKHPNIALITGPNMGGKSTVMRMTAAGVIMAQMGMLVPCESARLSPVDAILTRMGAYDSVFTNASTFKVELDECCKILRDATPKLGRGTSTFDGMAIASFYGNSPQIHSPLLCFATHYSSLTETGEKHPNIRNMTMETVVDEEKRQLVMMYKFIEGVAPGSFGTHVANVAGVPSSVVDRAEQVSRDFAEASRKKHLEKRAAVSRIPLELQADFAQLATMAAGLSLDDETARQRQKETLRILKGPDSATTTSNSHEPPDVSAAAKGKQRMVELPPVYAKAVAAATGSTMTALTMTPFDLIKTRLQTQPTATVAPPTLFRGRPPLQSAKAGPSSGLARVVVDRAAAADSVVCLWDGTWRSERVKGFWDAVVKVSRAEGVSGLWKGVGTSLTIAVPASTAYMLTYDHLNHSLPVLDSAPLVTPLAAGIASRSIVASLFSPLELVRTRIQYPNRTGHSAYYAVCPSWNTVDGCNRWGRSLWRGLGPTLWRDVPFSGIYWAGYESGKRTLKRLGHTGVDAAFVSGAGSGMIAALITMPFDTLKTRRQAALTYRSNRRSESAVAGLTPRVAKIAPACGIMIACYEGVGKFLSPIGPESDEVA
ncbi:DNA mismatch repair protein MutS [Ceratobasidium sp. AG-Ba]|nr:DNA mismatch repair protein MutS [Ceratobasidium sp. AG-Ba]